MSCGNNCRCSAGPTAPGSSNSGDAPASVVTRPRRVPRAAVGAELDGYSSTATGDGGSSHRGFLSSCGTDVSEDAASANAQSGATSRSAGSSSRSGSRSPSRGVSSDEEVPNGSASDVDEDLGMERRTLERQRAAAEQVAYMDAMDLMEAKAIEVAFAEGFAIGLAEVAAAAAVWS